jgi:hypothetical protein
VSTYEPGTVAVATVRGVPNVRVFRYREGEKLRWDSGERIDDGIVHPDHLVTDVRPLVVLDLGSAVPAVVVNVLRKACYNRLADQIEAQTKPPRIPEPGLWGVVEAHTAYDSTRRHFGRVPDDYNDDKQWIDSFDKHWRKWDDLIDPVLVRDGIEVAS